MSDFSVLVVDDEVDFVQPLLKRLERKNVDCEGASTGGRALEKMRSRGFDTVLLDMNLVDENGGEVLDRIKQLSPETQVVILTGYASASAGRNGLKHGAFDYLIKPVEFETLYERLRAAFNRKPSAVVNLSPESCKRNS